MAHACSLIGAVLLSSLHPGHVGSTDPPCELMVPPCELTVYVYVNSVSSRDTTADCCMTCCHLFVGDRLGMHQCQVLSCCQELARISTRDRRGSLGLQRQRYLSMRVQAVDQDDGPDDHSQSQEKRQGTRRAWSGVLGNKAFSFWDSCCTPIVSHAMLQ